MPTLYLNEQEVGGPATGIAYPNLRSCVGLTCVVGGGALIGAHLTALDDIAALTSRITAAIGTSNVERIYLIGGYGLVAPSPHGPTTGHPAAVAQALGYHGEVWTYDTAKKGYLGMLLVVDGGTPSGAVRIRYKNWEKLEPVTEYRKGEAHPYKDKGVPIVTTDVVRKAKKRDPNPALIMHELSLKSLKVTNV